MGLWLRKRGDADDVETLSQGEVFDLLDSRARELMGVSGEEAIRLAEKGELPDDLTGSIVESWVTMAKGAQFNGG